MLWAQLNNKKLKRYSIIEFNTFHDGRAWNTPSILFGVHILFSAQLHLTSVISAKLQDPHAKRFDNFICNPVTSLNDQYSGVSTGMRMVDRCLQNREHRGVQETGGVGSPVERGK
jgi:hypothetical protein